MLNARTLVAFNLALLCLVCASYACAFLFMAYQRVRTRYRRSRREVYEDAVLGALKGGPAEELAAALRPRMPGDSGAVEEALLAVLRRMRGAQAERLREAALRLGLYERHLRALRSARPDERGRAMQALGALRAPQAVAPLLAGLERESLALKLVSLQALADIGDPEAVPHVIAAAYQLPRVMVLRLAQLLLRFGPPGRRGVQVLVARFPASFPPRVLLEVLRQAADDGGDAA